MLKAVIFDMDGVLIDSEPIHTKAAVLLMEKYNVKLSEDFCNKFIGSTAKFMFEVIKQEYQLSVSVEELLVGNSKLIKELIAENGYPVIPYVNKLIMDLYAHNIKIAIASSSPVLDIEETVNNLKLNNYISVIVSGRQVLNPKPAPDIFFRTAELLNVDPIDCIVIEDSYNGVTAAKAAGMTRIGFLNQNSGIQDFSQVNFVIESFEEINTKFIKQVYQRSKGESVTISETERLIIRELTVNDIRTMYDIYQSPDVRQFVDDIDEYLNVEIEKHKAYIKNVYCFYGYGYWGVFSKSTGKLIGRCGIQNNEIDGKMEIELGYLLDVNHWGNGYAIECTKSVINYAFTELGIPRIVAIIDKLNSRSQKVAENIGMKIEKSFMHKHRECFLYVINKDK